MQTGTGVGCVHTQAVCDDGNACTDDACNPATGGCVFSNNASTCDDGNPCTGGDVCSGGTCSGSLSAAPPEIRNGTAAADKKTFTWLPQTSATRYDVVRGSTGAFPVGPGGGDEVCFDNLDGPTVVDAAIPGAGGGFFYLSRGENGCGNGTWGTQGFHGADDSLGAGAFRGARPIFMTVRARATSAKRDGLAAGRRRAGSL
jgi:hypothetical protein